MRTFNIQILVVFLLSFFSLNASVKGGKDSLAVRDRKNTIRVELLGKSPIYGILYERELTYNKWSSYLSFGIGVGNNAQSFFYPSMYNTSFYFKYNNWKIKPIIGLGIFMWTCSNPYPATLEERNLFRKGLGDVGGPPLKPPFDFYGYVILGGNIKISQRWSCLISYTPWFNYDFIIGKYQEQTNMIGLNIGYNF